MDDYLPGGMRYSFYDVNIAQVECPCCLGVKHIRPGRRDKSKKRVCGMCFGRGTVANEKARKKSMK